MNFRMTQWGEFFNDSLETSRKPLRKERRARRNSKGAKTNLPVNRWLALAFEWNEVRVVQSLLDPQVRPLSDEEIVYNLKLEFGGSRPYKKGNQKIKPGNSIFSGKHTIGFFRNKYRKAQIYAGQYRPILLSLKYDTKGRVLMDSKRDHYPTFRECQQLAIEFRTVDPRFFSTEDMERIHQHTLQEGTFESWSFPTKRELDEIYKITPVTLYRSVKTYDVFKDRKEKAPKKSRITPEKLNERNQEEYDKQLKELEQKRQDTQKFISSIEIPDEQALEESQD